MTASVTYVVLWPVKRGGRFYAGGERIDLTEGEAGVLLGLGAVSKLPESKRTVALDIGLPEPATADTKDTPHADEGAGKGADPGPSPAAAADEDRHQAIVDVIAVLDPEDAQLWTKSGAPVVAALERVLGHDITAAERDAAWEGYERNLRRGG